MPQTNEENYVDLVHPETGEVIPTVDWVAEQLERQGWKKKEDELAQNKPEEKPDGKKDHKPR